MFTCIHLQFHPHLHVHPFSSSSSSSSSPLPPLHRLGVGLSPTRIACASSLSSSSYSSSSSSFFLLPYSFFLPSFLLPSSFCIDSPGGQRPRRTLCVNYSSCVCTSARLPMEVTQDYIDQLFIICCDISRGLVILVDAWLSRIRLLCGRCNCQFLFRIRSPRHLDIYVNVH